jgi:hypothetical protein
MSCDAPPTLKKELVRDDDSDDDEIRPEELFPWIADLMASESSPARRSQILMRILWTCHAAAECHRSLGRNIGRSRRV